jgi:hypothetical protein
LTRRLGFCGCLGLDFRRQFDNGNSRALEFRALVVEFENRPLTVNRLHIQTLDPACLDCSDRCTLLWVGT